MTGRQLLDSLADVSWGVARRTFGNDHATLIGLLVEWWVSIDRSRHWVLEGAPSFDVSGEGADKRGHCDALLCQGSDPVGIVEVEGTRQTYTARKLGSFLGSAATDLKALQFAILLLYQCAPQGWGTKKAFPPAASPEALDAVAQVSAAQADRDLIVIGLEKLWEPDLRGIRARNPYYSGRVSEVRASWYRGGQVRENRAYAQGRVAPRSLAGRHEPAAC